MFHSIQWLLSALSIVGLSLPASTAWPQEAPTTFQACLDYVSALEEINVKVESHRTQGEELLAERQAAFERLLETKGTIAELQNEQMLGALALLETQMAGASLEAELNSAIQVQLAFDRKDMDVRYDPQARFRYFSSQVPINNRAFDLANQAAAAKVQIDAILHEMKTVHRAGNLAIQRHISIVLALQKINNQWIEWQAKSFGLFERYWQWSDVFGIRSNLERRTALRTLQRSSDNNFGAAFAQAITLMQLEEYDKALAILNVLVSSANMHGIATAARSELLARMGQSREAKLDLRTSLAVAPQDPRVRVHRAMTFSVLGELTQAEREWETVLKFGGNEIAARRAIAFINVAIPGERSRRKAAEQSMLASQLAGDDWASEAAVAMAAAANGDRERALAAAETARSLAVGDNQEVCAQLHQDIKAGVEVAWEF